MLPNPDPCGATHPKFFNPFRLIFHFRQNYRTLKYGQADCLD
jgi:hypothetical protein